MYQSLNERLNQFGWLWWGGTWTCISICAQRFCYSPVPLYGSSKTKLKGVERCWWMELETVSTWHNYSSIPQWLWPILHLYIHYIHSAHIQHTSIEAFQMYLLHTVKVSNEYLITNFALLSVCHNPNSQFEIILRMSVDRLTGTYKLRGIHENTRVG